MKRKCSVCGARVRNQNPKTTTCCPLCTRAKHAGRTMPDQIRYELDRGEVYADDFFYPDNEVTK